MSDARKSYELEVVLPDGMDRDSVSAAVLRAATATGLMISHIGGYSRVKYPESIHWHFKRDRKEPGLIDATYWQEGARFWIVVRHREPAWVHDTAPRLHAALEHHLTPS